MKKTAILFPVVVFASLAAHAATTTAEAASRLPLPQHRCAWSNGAAMADNGLKNDDNAPSGGGKGGLGDLVKGESMIQLAIGLPAGCVIGRLVGSWLDRHFH